MCTNCRRDTTQLRRGMCHACYERDRRAGRIDSLVSARTARQHIDLLKTAGWNLREIARAARMDRSVVALIVGGRERINAKTAVALCGIGVGEHDKFQRSCWDSRRANQARRQHVIMLARQRSQHDRATQRARQEIIMAQRRRDAEHNRELSRLIELPSGSWVDDALCAQIDPEIFFPDKGGSTGLGKRVCLACEVRQECLAYALDHGERFGIWGGKSERERRKILLQQDWRTLWTVSKS
jgi:WhiB family redox-sensing transcriptional regulator